MTSIYEHEKDEWKRPKRSRAGSIRPHTQERRVGSDGSRASPIPQAMVKVAGWATTPSSVKKMVEYISRTQDGDDRKDVEVELEDGELLQGKKNIQDLLEEWKPSFERRSRNSQKAPRHAVHLIFSAKADLTRQNVEKTLRAARETVQRHFAGRGYKVALGVHQDGNYPHVHAVVRTVSEIETQPKLRLGPKDLFEIRKTLADELTKEGLEHVATRQRQKEKTRHANLKGRAPDTLKRVEAVVGKLAKEQRQFERSMARKEPKVNAIKFRQQQNKALDTLRDQTQNDNTLAGKDREKAFNLIRSLRREVEKKGVNPDLEVRATVNHFENRITKWQKQLEKDQTKGSQEERDKQKEPTQKALEVGQALQRDIQQFIGKELRQQDIPVEAKKAIHARLRKQFLEIQKISERGLGRER